MSMQTGAFVPRGDIGQTMRGLDPEPLTNFHRVSPKRRIPPDGSWLVSCQTCHLGLRSNDNAIESVKTFTDECANGTRNTSYAAPAPGAADGRASRARRGHSRTHRRALSRSSQTAAPEKGKIAFARRHRTHQE